LLLRWGEGAKQTWHQPGDCSVCINAQEEMGCRWLFCSRLVQISIRNGQLWTLISYICHNLQCHYLFRIEIFLEPSIIIVYPRVTRTGCVQCKCIEHYFGAPDNSHLLYLLLFKLYGRQNSFISFHHMFVESNIMSTTKIPETKFSSVLLHKFKLQARVDREARTWYMCIECRKQHSNHETRLCKRVSKNRTYLRCYDSFVSCWFPCLLARTKIW